MKRVTASVIVGFLLLTTVLVSAAIAHTYVAETSLTIHKEPRGITDAGEKLFIFGKLRSPRPACRVNEWVKLMRVRPGPDRAIGRDRTGSDGNYRFVLHPVRDLTVYAKFFGSFRNPVGHSHRCLSSRSDNQVINVN
jgi:hypothetical protein